MKDKDSLLNSIKLLFINKFDHMLIIIVEKSDC